MYFKISSNIIYQKQMNSYKHVNSLGTFWLHIRLLKVIFFTIHDYLEKSWQAKQMS